MEQQTAPPQTTLESDNQTADKSNKVVNVAVAIIHYQQQYLLGFRNSSQHQGNRYEFVGGKIEADESATAALIREVVEETAIDISDNTAVKLGRLHHDYGDKRVCLQVYQVALSAEQYERHQYDRCGLEGQALTWVTKANLLAGQYPLPAANQTILTWLRLQKLISITYPLAHFDDCQDAQQAWLKYHQQHIVKDSWVYVRLKAVGGTTLAKQLAAQRPDMQMILPNQDGIELIKKEAAITNNKAVPEYISALHLSHSELIQWFDNLQNNPDDIQALALEQPLIVSCHDANSIEIANKLAAIRLQQQLPAVIGIFLAPVLSTATHPDVTPLGWQSWSCLAQLADMPVIGLGGLSPDMMTTAQQHGATSIAGIRQFLYA